MAADIGGTMRSRILHGGWLPLASAPSARALATAALYLAAYVVLEWASFIHIHNGLPVTPWDPGLGVAFALMLRGNPWGGPLLFVGMVIAELVMLPGDAAWPLVLGIAAATALSYAAVAQLARRRLRFDARLGELRDVLLLLGAGLAGAVIDTVALSAMLLAVGAFAPRDIAEVFRPLLIGDAIGIAVVTPLLLRFAAGARRVPARLPALLP
jgi:integral membrane sensor domain MASE1